MPKHSTIVLIKKKHLTFRTRRNLRNHLIKDHQECYWVFWRFKFLNKDFSKGEYSTRMKIRPMANGKGAHTSSWYLITDVFPIFCEGIFYWIKDLGESLMRYQPVRPHELGNSSTIDPWFTPSLATSLNLWTNIVIFKLWTTWSFLEKLGPVEQQIPHDLKHVNNISVRQV